MQVLGYLSDFILASDSDLCVLLSNALENALHACAPLVEAGQDCVIDVNFHERGKKFFLQITNPCQQEKVRLVKGHPRDRPAGPRAGGAEHLLCGGQVRRAVRFLCPGRDIHPAAVSVSTVDSGRFWCDSCQSVPFFVERGYPMPIAHPNTELTKR